MTGACTGGNPVYRALLVTDAAQLLCLHDQPDSTLSCGDHILPHHLQAMGTPQDSAEVTIVE